MSETLFTGTKVACTNYINCMEREGYKSIKKIQPVLGVDLWQVVATPQWEPTPEEIEAECAKIRERLKKNPRYNDGITANRVKKTDTAEARREVRVSPMEMNQYRLPDGRRP